MISVGLTSCDRMKTAVGMGGAGDFRNARIDVSGTVCSDNGKFTTLVLKDGKYEFAQYQFELFGEPKHGDVSGHTKTGANDSSVFVGDCAIDGQTAQLLFVYGADSGPPRRLGVASLTENGKGLVQSYDVKDSTILVEQNQGNPPILSKTSYALLNGKLADLSSPASAVTPAAAQNGDLDTEVISYQAFHDKLQPYGKWVDHPRWGRAWHPTQANFRPYDNGHWEDSDEYGSVWVSADPWGDTPYHYGRWGYDPNYGGWLWVPGYVWGPSWVVWRADNTHLGWFPIPPGDWDGEGDYPDEWASLYGYQGVLDAAAFYGLWSFVPAVDIFAGDVRGRIMDRGGNGRFIGHTHNWGHYGLSHGHVVSRAFDHTRFAANFHHDLPGGTRHGSAFQDVASFSVGRRIAEHERTGVHSGTIMDGTHLHSDSDFAHSSRGATGFSRMGSYHSGGLSHSGSGFERSYGSGGFSRSGGGFAIDRSENGGAEGGGRLGHGDGGGKKSGEPGSVDRSNNGGAQNHASPDEPH